jgi:hypothetical protein
MTGPPSAVSSQRRPPTPAANRGHGRTPALAALDALNGPTKDSSPYGG